MDLKELELSEKDKTSRHPWELARTSVVFDILSKHLPDLHKEGLTILDVGCGDTYFVETLSKELPGANCIAIDTAFNADALSFYKKKFEGSKIQVFDSVEASNRVNRNEISIVLLLDVIEHIEDDVNFLKYLQGTPGITSNTIFIITVPAFQALFCSHDVFLNHYRRYDNALLKKNTNEAGLTVISCGYFFSSLLFPRIINAFLEKINPPPVNSAKGIGGWKENKLRDMFLKSFLLTDYKFTSMLTRFGIKLPGLSNYALCKKPVS
jgi:hypothetical protein